MHFDSSGGFWGIILAGGEGTRVQSFLAQLCGGPGIKQFCAVIGRRSMLQHTVSRAERLIDRSRILVSLNEAHRPEAERQLTRLPAENLIFQPANLDTGPGILLPLAHISRRDPNASVAVFPSDHFIEDEASFMARVERAVAENRKHPDVLTLLGVTPGEPDTSYGWIEPGPRKSAGDLWTVRRFREKPNLAEARKLMASGGLWNTFVFVARAKLLWTILSETAPECWRTFWTIRLMLNSVYSQTFIAHAYRTLPPLNFSTAVLNLLDSRLRVFRVPEVGWSDWGTRERILASLRRVGRYDEIQRRLRRAPAADSNKAVPRIEQSPGLSL